MAFFIETAAKTSNLTRMFLNENLKSLTIGRCWERSVLICFWLHGSYCIQKDDNHQNRRNQPPTKSPVAAKLPTNHELDIITEIIHTCRKLNIIIINIVLTYSLILKVYMALHLYHIVLHLHHYFLIWDHSLPHFQDLSLSMPLIGE
jgi:hypothetical protein